MNLMNELYDCNQYLKIPLDTLWKMKVRDRKLWIARHNNAILETEKANKETSSSDSDRFTDLAQANLLNRNKA